MCGTSSTPRAETSPRFVGTCASAGSPTTRAPTRRTAPGSGPTTVSSPKRKASRSRSKPAPSMVRPLSAARSLLLQFETNIARRQSGAGDGTAQATSTGRTWTPSGSTCRTSPRARTRSGCATTAAYCTSECAGRTGLHCCGVLCGGLGTYP